MKLESFNFPLPDDRIARFPAKKREESKLMMVNKTTGEISHHCFKDIVHLINENDFLVMNNSKVIPVRLFGEINGKKVEVLIVNKITEMDVNALTLPAKKFKPGQIVRFEGDLCAKVINIGHRGKRTLRFNKNYDSVLEAGYAPLPPYIKRKFAEAKQFRTLDLERYQTVFSKNPGSIAAPTAGLHFSPQVIKQINEKFQIIEITLAVGEATFQKIEEEDISQHKMGRECITISNEERKRINQLKLSKQLIAVGTTSVRSLETFALNNPKEETFYSQLFITPGFEFKMVDKLITNFHLPQSTLFILVSALAGLELMQKAYRIAIEERYRFFSYGDVMFIV